MRRRCSSVPRPLLPRTTFPNSPKIDTDIKPSLGLSNDLWLEYRIFQRGREHEQRKIELQDALNKLEQREEKNAYIHSVLQTTIQNLKEIKVKNKNLCQGHNEQRVVFADEKKRLRDECRAGKSELEDFKRDADVKFKELQAEVDDLTTQNKVLGTRQLQDRISIDDAWSQRDNCLAEKEVLEVAHRELAAVYDSIHDDWSRKMAEVVKGKDEELRRKDAELREMKEQFLEKNKELQEAKQRYNTIDSMWKVEQVRYQRHTRDKNEEIKCLKEYDVVLRKLEEDNHAKVTQTRERYNTERQTKRSRISEATGEQGYSVLEPAVPAAPMREQPPRPITQSTEVRYPPQFQGQGYERGRYSDGVQHHTYHGRVW